MRTRTVLPYAFACVIALSATVAGCTRPPGGGGGPGPTDPPVTAPPGGGGGGSIQNGPAPTQSSVQSASGPFRYTTKNVTGSGFASATVYTPTGTPQGGKWGGIILVPPFMVNNTALAPFAQRYASNGFIVLSLNARSTSDFPPARATQARAALSVLKSQPMVDASRIAVGGYSMGGGATMELANSDPSFKAAVPMVPWNPGQRYGNDRVPTLILGGSADTVAAPAQNATVFYNSIPSGTPKALAIASGASHFVPSTPPAGFTQLAVSWMKYYVDGDARYKQFITRPGGLSTWQISGV